MATAQLPAQLTFIKVNFENLPASYGQTDAKLVRLTLNRPKRGNSLTPRMVWEMLKTLEYLDSTWRESKIRLLVLTGEGKYFCTGMDMQQATASGDDSGPKLPEDPVPMFQQMFMLLNEFPLPTLCLLNGPALGGGCGLFFACDIRVATAPDHYIALTEVRRGLLPALISPIIVDSLGKSTVLELMLTGGRLTMPRMYQMGQLSSIVGEPTSTPLTSDPKSLREFSKAEDLVLHYAAMICQGGPQAVVKCKSMVRALRASDEEWERRLDQVRKRFREMMDSEEAQYGMMSFLQKQRPDWSKL